MEGDLLFLASSLCCIHDRSIRTVDGVVDSLFAPPELGRVTTKILIKRIESEILDESSLPSPAMWKKEMLARKIALLICLFAEQSKSEYTAVMEYRPRREMVSSNTSHWPKK